MRMRAGIFPALSSTGAERDDDIPGTPASPLGSSTGCEARCALTPSGAPWVCTLGCAPPPPLRVRRRAWRPVPLGHPKGCRGRRGVEVEGRRGRSAIRGGDHKEERHSRESGNPGETRSRPDPRRRTGGLKARMSFARSLPSRSGERESRGLDYARSGQGSRSFPRKQESGQQPGLWTPASPSGCEARFAGVTSKKALGFPV